jgi:hypothetical protein
MNELTPAYLEGRRQLHRYIVDTRPDDVVQHLSLGPLAVYQVQAWPAENGRTQARGRALDAHGNEYTATWFTSLAEIAERGDAMAWPTSAVVARWIPS